MSSYRWKFFLTMFLKLLLQRGGGFEGAFSKLARKYGIRGRESRKLYYIAYHLVVNYYGLRALAREAGLKPTPRNIVDRFAALGYDPAALSDELSRLVSGMAGPMKLSLKYSYPLWLVEELLSHMLPQEAEKMLESLNTRKRYIRALADPDKVVKCFDNEGIALRDVKYVPGLFEVVNDPFAPIGGTRCYREGLAISEDISSAIVVELLKGFSGDLLDACSAPGTKLLQLLRSGRFRRAIAVDYSAKRINYIPQLVGDSGFNVIVVNSDSRRASFSADFGLIFIDAPCTGSGAVYGDPSVKLRLEPHRVKRFRKIQEELVSNLIREGKDVVYVVCSIIPQEGEALVQDIERKYEVELMKFEGELVGPGYRNFDVSDRVNRIYPHVARGQGFFISWMRSSEK